MFSYSIAALPFLAAVLLLDIVLLKTRVVLARNFWLVLALLLSLTAVFNQLLTGLPIVEYNHAKTLGVKLGYMPLEDFSYAVAVAIGIGSLFSYEPKSKTKS